MYRRKVEALHANLNHPDSRTEAAEIIRGLVERIKVRNRDDGFEIHAAMRADELLDEGNLDGAAMWRRVIQAIKELENTAPNGAVH